MRVADYIADRLAFLGVDTAFAVTGGGAMHLNDAIGAHPALGVVYCHHEQGAAMAAEAYARLAARPALLNVTTGPGGINALNGVFGAFTDSIPLVVVSGQVKRETLRHFQPVPGLRQLGDQEVDIVAMARPITKWVALLTEADAIADLLDTAWCEATSGRPGPVWLDVPVDLQGAALSPAVAARVHAPLPRPSTALSPATSGSVALGAILDELARADRPVILAGSGVRIGGATDELLALAEGLDVPVVTAWMHDIFPNDHRLYAGRPGTIGTRAGNFVVQNADLVIVLGSRLNIRQVSYNPASFARHARKVWVDIDPAEFRKPFVRADLEIAADLKSFLPALTTAARAAGWVPAHSRWVEWCATINQCFTPVPEDYPLSDHGINAYHFIAALFERLDEGDVVVCGDATATIVPWQIGRLKAGMRLLSNSGSASMGYDIPAALGAAVALSRSSAGPRRVICLAGDGSSMMNVQELQTIRGLDLDVLVFILDNDGYLSIKQTQRNFFGREAGSSSASGLSFPDFAALGAAFGFETARLERDDWESRLDAVLAGRGPRLGVVHLDRVQEFEPRLRSRMADGVITTPELDDMYPFMEPAALEAVRAGARRITRDADGGIAYPSPQRQGASAR